MFVGALYFWLYLFGNPVNELLLILKGQSTTGSIIDTWEDAQTRDVGGVQWTHAAAYTYRLPDGREITAWNKNGSGRLKRELREIKAPITVTVEYLPRNPQISRIKGDGCQTVLEWLWRKVGVGGVLLLLLVSPGFWLLNHSLKNLKRLHAGLEPKPAPVE